MRDLIRDIRRHLEQLRTLGFQVWLEDAPRGESAQHPPHPRPAIAPNEWKQVQLLQLAEEVAACRKCSLGALRKNPVFGEGNPDADLVFIGEAPGATEDDTGRPFVGAAGNLLTEELAKHGIRREEVFICNILKCRPPQNRDPYPEEIAACEPYLLRQLDLLKPKMLCALGRFAAMTLLRRPVPIMRMRGTWQRYHDIPLFICLHPAASLHQPANRKYFEKDIETLANAYHSRHTPDVAPAPTSLFD